MRNETPQNESEENEMRNFTTNTFNLWLIGNQITIPNIV